MNKAVLFVISGAALFAAGYFTRYTTHPAAEAEKKAGPVAAATALRSDAPVASAAEKAAADQSVRKFVAGRPFPKGGAKAWLMSMAGLDMDDEDRMPELMDAALAVMTMDEECAKEMADALMEIGALVGNDDPSLAPFPNASDLVEGGLMLAMIRLSSFNPEAALELMKKNPDAMDEMTTLFVFGRLTSQNPERAEELAMALPEDNRGDAMQAILKSMANKDPRAALAFAQKHPDDISQADMTNVLENWSKREPQAALAEAVKLTGDTGNTAIVRNVFTKWMERDDEAATAWAATHEGPGKTAVQAILLEEKAKEDAASVLGEFAALQKSAKNQEDLQRLATIIAVALAKDDVAAAKNWVDSLTPGEAKDATVIPFAHHWLAEDAEAASAWIKELPAGAPRDGAVSLLTDKIMRRDPAAALEWARSIQSGNMRGDRIRTVLSAWEEQDPDAANAARAALPPELVRDATEFDPPQIPQTFDPQLLNEQNLIPVR